LNVETSKSYFVVTQSSSWCGSDGAWTDDEHIALGGSTAGATDETARQRTINFGFPVVANHFNAFIPTNNNTGDGANIQLRVSLAGGAYANGNQVLTILQATGFFLDDENTDALTATSQTNLDGLNAEYNRQDNTVALRGMSIRYTP